MTRIYKGLLVVAVGIGVWGCGKGSASAVGDRVRQLEAQVARLEEDAKSVAAARDTLRAKLAAAEGQTRAEAARAAAAEADRGRLAGELTARTAEREQLRASLDGFRTDLKALLGRTEAALAAPGVVPATPVSEVKPAGRTAGS
jgi:septal ring factor EnvC (AmiA/AmiB activator)